jgi:hypothetical protein
MATPLLQKARQRKMIYFGAIVALFTLSLVHREFIVKPQATLLQLRETARGQVELTSSAVRLMLTGSRGLAVTLLWYTAMDKQKRGEYHELELIVASITKLQPYFITPWLYQSWNISFNVAVECDRPRDKYYYISRGLELLAEGERRNSGTAGKGAMDDPNRIAIPGNPELRHFMGFIYQLKIGSSDERLTMRSLLELSCIDPIQRNPDLFWTTNEKGQKTVNIAELAKFAERHPRLIRRLNEQLQYTSPQRIVQFLDDHRKIPSRYVPIDQAKKATITVSERKDPLDQFPILPPHQGSWPDTNSTELTSESIDVFLVCRTWYEYAQQPLPPPDQNPNAIVPDYDKLKYRVPKGMVTQIFRQYPARAQVFIAETLEAEGFFDQDGWDASKTFKKWSNRSEVNAEEFTFGKESKYHSRAAWQRGYDMYKDFGVRNGIYIAPAVMAELNQRAKLVRDQLNLASGTQVEMRPEWRETPMGESVNAQNKLYFSDFYRRLINYDTYLYQSEGEADPLTATARKMLFEAERQRKYDARTEVMLETYRRGWDLYLHACLKHPRFAQVASMQEDLYEVHQRYLYEMQQLNNELFRQTALQTARIFWPEPSALEAAVRLGMVVQFEIGEQADQGLVDGMPIRKRYGSLDLMQYYDGPAAQATRTALYAASQVGLAAGNAISPMGPNLRLTAFSATLTPEAADRLGMVVQFQTVANAQQALINVIPIRKRYGPLDMIQYYDGPSAKEMKTALYAASQIGLAAGNASSATGPNIRLTAFSATMAPEHEYFYLTRTTKFAEENPPPDWRPIITSATRLIANGRLNLDR